MNPLVRGKLALVTGASGGIGEAFAHVLAADGYALVLTARQDRELNRVRGVIAARHQVPVTVIAMDLAAAGACDRLASELAARNLAPDLVVNNAGFGLVGPAAQLPAAEQLAMVDLNIRALTDLSLRFLPTMLARKSGGIVNVASTGAFMPGPNMAVYYASKNYVLAFSDALHEELKGTGVTVTTVCPGPVETGFQHRAGIGNARAMVGGGLKPVDVAEQAMDAFKRGERMVIPGAMNKMIAYAMRGAPRRMILPLIKRVMARARGA
jgi:short-subunit dehydrogenase